MRVRARVAEAMDGDGPPRPHYEQDRSWYNNFHRSSQTDPSRCMDGQPTQPTQPPPYAAAAAAAWRDPTAPQQMLPPPQMPLPQMPLPPQMQPPPQMLPPQGLPGGVPFPHVPGTGYYSAVPGSQVASLVDYNTYPPFQGPLMQQVSMPQFSMRSQIFNAEQELYRLREIRRSKQAEDMTRACVEEELQQKRVRFLHEEAQFLAFTQGGGSTRQPPLGAMGMPQHTWQPYGMMSSNGGMSMSTGMGGS